MKKNENENVWIVAIKPKLVTYQLMNYQDARPHQIMAL